MIQDHERIEVSNFGGLYGRGTFADSVPADHFIDSLNTTTNGDEIGTRDGVVLGITLANIRRIAIYKREGEADRLLILNSSYSIYDASVSLVTPILTVTGMTDFSVAQYYNRAYISPHNGVSGLAGEFVYVYQGSGTARKAAGVAPSSGFNIALSATTGVVETGLHIFAWVYETDTGFVTPPGPTTFQTITTDGTKSLDFSNIPVGPSGTSARRLIASRAIQDYSGNQDGYEMFFVPGGRIENNSATTLGAVDFYDADLQDSADYTFDQLDEIPACLFMAAYGSCSCYGNTDEDKSLVYVSKATEPESINSLAGFIICDPHETEGIKSAVEFRGSLYITKGNPGHTYVTKDNGYEASTWTVITLDKGIGADLNGTSQYLDAKGANADFFCVADTAGLFRFDGTYGDPKLHLAFKIQNIWNRINKAYMNKCQLIIDSKQFLIYCLVPLDSATSPSHILVGDYSNGLDYLNIRWHIWKFADFAPASITVAINNTTKKTYLRVAGYTGNVYDITPGQLNDVNTAIENYIQFALHYQEPNYVHHFAGLGFRIKGAGNLIVTLRGEDDASSQTLANLTLASSPGKEYFKQCNFVNEKCSAKIYLNTASKWFKLRLYAIYCKPFWSTRPA